MAREAAAVADEKRARELKASLAEEARRRKLKEYLELNRKNLTYQLCKQCDLNRNGYLGPEEASAVLYLLLEPAFPGGPRDQLAYMISTRVTKMFSQLEGNGTLLRLGTDQLAAFLSRALESVLESAIQSRDEFESQLAALKVRQVNGEVLPNGISSVELAVHRMRSKQLQTDEGLSEAAAADRAEGDTHEPLYRPNMEALYARFDEVLGLGPDDFITKSSLWIQIVVGIVFTLLTPITTLVAFFAWCIRRRKWDCKGVGIAASMALFLLVADVLPLLNVIVYFSDYSRISRETTFLEVFGPLVMFYLVSQLSNGASVLMKVFKLNRNQQSDFSEENVREIIQLFHREMRIEWIDDSKAEKGKPISIHLLKRNFGDGTKDKFREVNRAYCLVGCLMSDYFLYPLAAVQGITTAFVPAIVRGVRGSSPFGTNPPEKTISAIYVVVAAFSVSVFLGCLNQWLKRAGFSTFRFSAIGALHRSYRAEKFGLPFFIPLNSPTNLEGWVTVRRQLFFTVKNDLDRIFPVEKMLGPLVLAVLAVAGTMFAYAVQGDTGNTFNIVGMFVLVLLTFYTLAILLFAANINLIMNDSMVAMLAGEKFEVARGIWEQSRAKELSLLATDEKSRGRDSIDKLCLTRRRRPASGDGDAKAETKVSKTEIGLPDIAYGVARGTYETLLQHRNTAMEVMIDSIMDKIRNVTDEGLYIKAFSVPITTSILAALASAAITAISAAASQMEA